jgi:hypothetical protein
MGLLSIMPLNVVDMVGASLIGHFPDFPVPASALV